jgi:hypothetical protein
MDSNIVNRWLTLGANLGVLVGIILILIELNQNADLMRAQIAQSRADNLISSMEDRMHSDHWPAVSAKLRFDGQMRGDDIASLSPEERERVLYYYLREVNDIRNQFLQRQAGYLPETLWETSTRLQIGRMMNIAAALNRRCNRDREFAGELNRIAREEGAPQCLGDNEWQYPEN